MTGEDARLWIAVYAASCIPAGKYAARLKPEECVEAAERALAEFRRAQKVKRD